jgi:hypothetical protein
MGGRRCTICSHESVGAIDRALIAGRPIRGIAKTFGASEDAVGRQRAHLPKTLLNAHDVAESVRADELLAEATALQAKAWELLHAAEANDDQRTALMAVREIRGCLELLARVLGEIQDRPMFTLVTALEWFVLRGALLTALAPFPEARSAVAGQRNRSSWPSPSGRSER